MKKILILLGVCLLLSGCVSIKVEGDTCYRFVDTQGVEHITTVYDDRNSCWIGNHLYCSEYDKIIKVVEYEEIKCTVK